MNTKVTKEGWTIVEQDTHLGKWVEESGKLNHDTFLPEIARKNIHTGDVVIDCGANIGTHTIVYSEAVGVRGMVIAIEAGSLAFECLKANVARFKHPNTFSVHAALSELDGYTVSHEPNENIGASMCREMAKEDLVPGTKYLRTITLDALALQSEKKIDFIKLDIEGFEVKALIGASKTLQKDHPTLLIEINPGALHEQGDSPVDIYDILEHWGYSHQIVQENCTIDSPQYDILCKPNHKNN